MVVAKLELGWVKDNVEVLYPSNEKFEVTALEGIVLWKDPAKEKYQLLEGNHRISAWLDAKAPAVLPSVMYIGKAKKSPNLL